MFPVSLFTFNYMFFFYFFQLCNEPFSSLYLLGLFSFIQLCSLIIGMLFSKFFPIFFSFFCHLFVLSFFVSVPLLVFFVYTSYSHIVVICIFLARGQHHRISVPMQKVETPNIKFNEKSMRYLRSCYQTYDDISILSLLLFYLIYMLSLFNLSSSRTFSLNSFRPSLFLCFKLLCFYDEEPKK